MPNFAPLVRYLIYAEYFFNLLNCSLIVVGAYYNRRVYAETHRQIDAIDRRLMPPIGGHDDVQLRRYLRGFYVILLLFVGVLVVLLVNFESTVFGLFIGVCSFALPNLMVMLTLAMYFCLMRLLRLRFERVATELWAICGNADNEEAVQNDMFMLEFHAVIGTRRPVESITTVARLNELRDLYHDLGRIVETTNNGFGRLIISLLLAAVVIITGQLYTIYANANGNHPLGFLYAGVWMAANFLKVTLVLYWNACVVGAVSLLGLPPRQITTMGQQQIDNNLTVDRNWSCCRKHGWRLLCIGFELPTILE